jgi:hypothetical protein
MWPHILAGMITPLLFAVIFGPATQRPARLLIRFELARRLR